MIDSIDDHFILVDKCADQTRIIEILSNKIVKMIFWFDEYPPLIGSIQSAIIIKKLNGGVVRAKIEDNTILSVRRISKSLNVNSKIRVIITSEKFEDKPIQARILPAHSKNYENLDDTHRIIAVSYTHLTLPTILLV